MEDGKVDVRLCDLAKEVGQHVFGRERHDLHDLGFAIAGLLDRSQICVADAASGLHHLNRKADRGGGLGVGRAAFARKDRVLERDLRKVEANVGVGGEAIVAAVRFGDRDCDALAVLRSSVLARAPLRFSSPSSAAGLNPKTRKRFGTTPNLLWTASNNGLEPSGAVSNVGIVMRDIEAAPSRSVGIDWTANTYDIPSCEIMS